MRDRDLSRPFPTPLPVGLFHLETPEAGAPAPAADPAPSPEPAPAGDPAPAVPEPAAPAAAWAPSQDSFERLEFMVNRISQDIYTEPDGDPNGVAAAPADGAGPRLDPLDDDFGTALASFLDERIAAAVEQATAPFHQQRQQEAFREADQRALDILDSIKNQPGSVEFDPQLARAIAREFMPAAAERWGGLNPRAAEEALTSAARALQANNQRVAEQAVNRYKAELEQTAGAGGRGALSGATGLQTTPEAGDEVELARRLAGRMRV